MDALSASGLLDAWELGLGQSPVQRALILLAAASPEVPPDTLARLSIGQRDSHLLTLREQLFGPELVSLVVCPNCGERLELSFRVADIRAEPKIELTETFSLDVSGYELSFRLPNSLDLIALIPDDDPAETRQQLLERCLLTVHHQGQEQAADQMPVEALEALLNQMSQLDPQVEIKLDLACPACDHQWLATFDILSFLWSEIEAWAYRILREVHTLASVYGWREADILAMSPWRRRLYLEMINKG